ncbi:MAG: D-alanyl-D-alanine carboxypeptidase/D-alanyl-D-alanine-endopeptidase [Bacillus sp. (in: firmicutes)]
MRKSMRLYALAFLLLLVAIMPIGQLEGERESAVASGEELGGQISVLLEHEDLKGGIVGISVRDASDGREIYTHNADTRLQPASSMKLVTAAAALEMLGPDHHFTTEILTDGKVQGKQLKGNLYLKGRGDPTLLAEHIEGFAANLKSKGIKSIKGNIVADDHWFDDVRLSMDLPWTDEQEYYGAQISALTVSPDSDYDAGTVIVQLQPGKSTAVQPAVMVQPQNSYVKVVNKAKTGDADSKKTIKIKREHGSNIIVVEGSIPLGATAHKTWVAVWEPERLAANLFSEALHSEGIKWNGKILDGETPDKATLLNVHESAPLEEIMIPFMKLSNNTIAETLVKEVGRQAGEEGSWEEGLAMVEDAFDDLGINPQSILMRDGSGVSHVAMISANNLTSLLVKAQSKPWFKAYRTSLPVAGNSNRLVGGTLRNRMKGTEAEGNVIAKTGTITSASSLSGYVTAKGGRELVFSIIINHTINDDELKKIEDRFAVILAQFEGEE